MCATAFQTNQFRPHASRSPIPAENPRKKQPKQNQRSANIAQKSWCARALKSESVAALRRDRSSEIQTRERISVLVALFRLRVAFFVAQRRIFALRISDVRNFLAYLGRVENASPKTFGCLSRVSKRGGYLIML